jgi:sugar/nucleoside kinase (ribokinase family)
VSIPGNIVDVVDITGAGDSFIESFLFSVVINYTI